MFMGQKQSLLTHFTLVSPATSTSPASNYWGIDQSLTYGSTSIMDTTAGIVDTGTTLILLPTGEAHLS